LVAEGVRNLQRVTAMVTTEGTVEHEALFHILSLLIYKYGDFTDKTFIYDNEREL